MAVYNRDWWVAFSTQLQGVHSKVVSWTARGISAAKDAKDANIMTPTKEDNGKQWWYMGVRETAVA